MSAFTFFSYLPSRDALGGPRMNGEEDCVTNGKVLYSNQRRFQPSTGFHRAMHRTPKSREILVFVCFQKVVQQCCDITITRLYTLL